MNGVLVVDKPLRMSSAQAVARVRHRTGGAKVGHAGTLDPLATGVLVLCLGRATKQIDALMAAEKEYLAEIDLGVFSPSDDLETEPVAVEVERIPTMDEIRAACDRFLGEIEQRPPTYSAVHIDGQRAYDLVRAGKLEERPAAKRVRVDSIRIVNYEWPMLTLDIQSGKGVYIRSLARDLGDSLGVGGMLRSLRRTRAGRYRVEDAMRFDPLPDRIGPEMLMAVDAVAQAEGAGGASAVS